MLNHKNKSVANKTSKLMQIARNRAVVNCNVRQLSKFVDILRQREKGMTFVFYITMKYSAFTGCSFLSKFCRLDLFDAKFRITVTKIETKRENTGKCSFPLCPKVFQLTFSGSLILIFQTFYKGIRAVYIQVGFFF